MPYGVCLFAFLSVSNKRQSRFDANYSCAVLGAHAGEVALTAACIKYFLPIYFSEQLENVRCQKMLTCPIAGIAKGLNLRLRNL